MIINQFRKHCRKKQLVPQEQPGFLEVALLNFGKTFLANFYRERHFENFDIKLTINPQHLPTAHNLLIFTENVIP